MGSIFELLKNNQAIRDFLKEYAPQLRRMAVICVAGLVVFAGYSLLNGGNDPQIQSSDTVQVTDSAPETSDDASAAATPLDGTLFVDIGGAVKSPMLAELPDGSRVDDAIKAAGGLRKEADMTNINRAEFLVDGQKIFIPSYSLDEEGNIIESEDPVSSGTSVPGQTVTTDGKVNINTADADQLQTLNGVGPATAQKIIDYRDSSGRFTSVEDIKNVSGIGEKTFEKLRDYITV